MFAQPLHPTAAGPSPWFAHLQAPSAPLEPLAAPIDLGLTLTPHDSTMQAQSLPLSQQQQLQQTAQGNFAVYPKPASQSVSPALSHGGSAPALRDVPQQQLQQPVHINGGMLTVSASASASSSGCTSRTSPSTIGAILPCASTSSVQMQTPVQMDVKVQAPWEMFPVKGSFGAAFHDHLKPTTALVTGDRYSQLLEAKLGALQPPAPISTPISTPFPPNMPTSNMNMCAPPSSPWQYPAASTSAPSPLMSGGMPMPNSWAQAANTPWNQMLPAAASFAQTTPVSASAAPALAPAPTPGVAWTPVRHASSPMMPPAHSRTSSGSPASAMPNSSPFNSLLGGSAPIPTSLAPAMSLSMPPPHGALPEAQSQNHLSTDGWATSWLGGQAEQAPTLFRFRTNPVGPLSPSRTTGAVPEEVARIMQTWAAGQAQWDGSLPPTLPSAVEGPTILAQGATRESMPEAYYAAPSWPTAPFVLPAALPPPPQRNSPGLRERMNPAAATAQAVVPDVMAPSGAKPRTGSKMSLSLALPSAPVRTVGASSGRAEASAGSNSNSNSNGSSDRAGRGRGSGAHEQGGGSNGGRGHVSEDGRRGDERAGSGGSGGGGGGGGGGGSGGGDEDEGPKPNIACHNCRARKLKCDGEKPRCHQCARTGQEACSYDKVLKRRGPGKKTREKEKEKERLRQQAKEEEMRERERILDLHRQNGANEDEIQAMRAEMAKGGGGRDKRDDRGFVDVQIERHPLSDGWGAKRAKVAAAEKVAEAGAGGSGSGAGGKAATKGKAAARGGQASAATTAAGSAPASASAGPVTEQDSGSAIAPELMRAEQPSSYDYGRGHGYEPGVGHGYERGEAYSQPYYDRDPSHGRDGGSSAYAYGGSRYPSFEYGPEAGYGYAQGPPPPAPGHGHAHPHPHAQGHYSYDRGYGDEYGRAEYSHGAGPGPGPGDGAAAGAGAEYGHASAYQVGYAYGGSGSPTGNGNGNGNGTGYGYGHGHGQGYAYEGTPPDAPRVIRIRTPELGVGVGVSSGSGSGSGQGWEEGERGMKRRADEQGGRE